MRQHDSLNSVERDSILLGMMYMVAECYRGMKHSNVWEWEKYNDIVGDWIATRNSQG